MPFAQSTFQQPPTGDPPMLKTRAFFFALALTGATAFLLLPVVQAQNPTAEILAHL
jgi:hypothetical protein